MTQTAPMREAPGCWAAARTADSAATKWPFPGASCPQSPEAFPAGTRGHVAPYLRGLREDELRVLHQALQGHSHVDHLHLLVLPAPVVDKFPIPGVDDDEP